MIRSGVLFLCEKYFSDDVLRGKRLSEIDSVDLYSAAILPPLHHSQAIAQNKKATLRWPFLFPNSLFYSKFLFGAQGGT
ncbi:hypothetical protein [Photorhabdus hainanensis]|uniref:hypothetical protein n=1 Tax=Photorhabdus hainanensis TaxID=1004166 RepID=UPI001BD4DE53|nr:hypothetical protein [Photorhabdus hainanensis]